MIHKIYVGYPEATTKDVLVDFINNTIIFDVFVDGYDLTNHKIEAVLWDTVARISKSNTLAGGSDEEISEIEAPSNMSGFRVIIKAKETDSFTRIAYLTINITDTNGSVSTIVRNEVELKLDFTRY